MMIVSLMLYHIVVNIAMTKIVSMVTVASIFIRKPYTPTGIDMSNIIVTIATIARVIGDICFLIEANENAI